MANAKLSGKAIAIKPDGFKEMIKPHKPIRLAMEKKAGGGKIETKILRIEGEFFYVATTEDFAPPLGARAQFLYYGEKALYLFVAKLIKVFGANETGFQPMLSFRIPAEVNRIQRRTNYRVVLEAPIIAEKVDDENSAQILGKSCNISASGLFFILQPTKAAESLLKGDALKVEFYFPDDDVLFSVAANIVRIVDVSNPNHPDYADGYTIGLGLEFVELNKKDQERLFQFLWSKQREKTIK